MYKDRRERGWSFDFSINLNKVIIELNKKEQEASVPSEDDTSQVLVLLRFSSL